MLAQISNRAAELSDRYQVPERFSSASRAVREGASVAGEAAKKYADTAYRAALSHPRTSIGGAIVAAALIAGALWYLFGTEGKPVQRRRKVVRVRAGGERRRKSKSRAARPAAGAA